MVKNERIEAFWLANSRYNWDHVTNAPMSRCQLDLFVSVVLFTKESARLNIPAYAHDQNFFKIFLPVSGWQIMSLIRFEEHVDFFL